MAVEHEVGLKVQSPINEVLLMKPNRDQYNKSSALSGGFKIFP